MKGFVSIIDIRPHNDFPNDGTKFYWRARTQNAAGWGDWSSVWSFTNGTTPP